MRAPLFLLFLVGLLGCTRTQIDPGLLDRPMEKISFQPSTPREWVLPNGLKVMFMEDRELPLVTGTLYLKGGSLWSEPDAISVIGAMGAQMRQGGAGTLSADDLDLELEKLAATVASSFGDEFGSVGFSSLATDFERVFEIFAQVVHAPRFENNRLQLWKGQQLEGILRRKDDPHTVGSIAFSQLLFGETPYGWVSTSADIMKINRLDLLRAHRQLVRPNGAILALTGQINEEELRTAVTKHFGSWEPRKEALPSLPEIAYKPKPGIYFVELPFEQTTVILGQQSVRRLSPDHINIKVFNEIFGEGGFTSRLTERIRVQLGLAYSTYGATLPGLMVGKNVIMLQTKAQTTVQALDEASNVLAQLQNVPAPEAELSLVKQSIQNSFVFEFDSPAKVLGRRVMLELMNYPADYDAHYLERIVAVSPSEVQGVAKRLWDLKAAVIVAVGNNLAYELLVKAYSERAGALPIKKMKFDQKLVM